MLSRDSVFDKARESLKSSLTNEDPKDRIPNSYLEPINDFLKHFLPEKYHHMSYAEIARQRTEDGRAVGLEAIAKAWDKAAEFATTRAALNDEEGRQFKQAVIDIATLASGGGTFDNQFQNYMIGFDKYHASRLPAHLEMSGPTFITRPRLCLQSSNLRNNARMMPLDTANPNSLAFAIRYLLDTNLCNELGTHASTYRAATTNCPLINPESPWFTPLCNAVTSISGFPDFNLQTDSTDGGYFGEAQTFAKGADDFNRGSYSLNVTFRELPGGVISAILYYWLEYIRCVTRGIMLAYPDDIDGQIMNYTVSIYQFNMDPSQQYIVRWCKCTGCFPSTLDFGSMFSKSEGAWYQEAVQKVSTTFLVNKVEYMNPNSLMDFNTLAMRYCPEINSRAVRDETGAGETGYAQSDMATGRSGINLNRPSIPYSPFSNFCGLPYITSDPSGYKLVYRATDRDIYNDPMIQKLIACDVARTEKEWQIPDAGNNRYTLYQKYNYEDFYTTQVNKFKYNYNPYKFDQVVDDILQGKF